MIRSIGFVDPWVLQVLAYKHRKSIDSFLDLTAEIESPEWASVKKAMTRCLLLIEPAGPRPEVIGIGIHRLAAKEAKPWTSDSSGERGSIVFHLPIVTNPLVNIYSGPMGLHLQVGQLAFVATDVPNSAINMGDSPAFHLVIEVKRPIPQPTETVQ